MEIQANVSQWLGQIASYLPFGYAFGAGMVSAVNPCGFAMLPVYLSLYLGAEDQGFQHSSWMLRLLKAVWITTLVTSGFGILFGIVGIIVSAGGAFLIGIMPWVAVAVGGLLVFLGCWILLGNYLSFNIFLNMAGKIGDPRNMSVKGFFLFGVAFGATSLSCTLPIFLVVVGGSLTAGDFLGGIQQFLAYILGMGAVLLILTMAIAFVKGGVVVGAMKKMMPYIQKISAGLIIVAGGYIIYYWMTSGLLLS